ncbi:hypothetical protein MKEN_01467500 [Mycena kentingensis (nom. inval.)]|nr:hypothetical protein MKEN_01467500 [Mycena kentingensis (nom. inval.)]
MRRPSAAPDHHHTLLLPVLPLRSLHSLPPLSSSLTHRSLRGFKLVSRIERPRLRIRSGLVFTLWEAPRGRGTALGGMLPSARPAYIQPHVHVARIPTPTPLKHAPPSLLDASIVSSVDLPGRAYIQLHFRGTHIACPTHLKCVHTSLPDVKPGSSAANGGDRARAASALDWDPLRPRGWAPTRRRRTTRYRRVDGRWSAGEGRRWAATLRLRGRR